MRRRTDSTPTGGVVCTKGSFAGWIALVAGVPDAGFPMVLPGRRPGAFVRSVLAGMFALTRTLRLGWPDLADAIRTGASMGAPDELHLLMHLYSGPHRFVTSGIGKATLPLHHPASASLESTFGEIAWPPLHFVLVHRDEPCSITSPWTPPGATSTPALRDCAR
jgi:hypothetical protein